MISDSFRAVVLRGGAKQIRKLIRSDPARLESKKCSLNRKRREELRMLSRQF
jgi:hypothetical protein